MGYKTLLPLALLSTLATPAFADVAVSGEELKSMLGDSHVVGIKVKVVADNSFFTNLSNEPSDWTLFLDADEIDSAVLLDADILGESVVIRDRAATTLNRASQESARLTKLATTWLQEGPAEMLSHATALIAASGEFVETLADSLEINQAAQRMQKKLFLEIHMKDGTAYTNVRFAGLYGDNATGQPITLPPNLTIVQ